MIIIKPRFLKRRQLLEAFLGSPLPSTINKQPLKLVQSCYMSYIILYSIITSRIHANMAQVSVTGHGN
jgi:hypothetical protein